MVFSSVSFLFYFLPMFLLIYFSMPHRGKNYILLVASLLFYYVGVGSQLFVMLGCIALNYGAALLLHGIKEKPVLRRIVLALTVILSFGILFYFKYIDFVIENVNALFGGSIDLLGVLLPIGISFYIFQTVSYTIDVYRGDVLPQKNPLLLATYVTMFPQLVAGPIVRYSDIEKSLLSRTVSLEKITQGIGRFTVGLAKKVILANTLALLCSQIREAEDRTILLYWIWALAFLFNIYFDFSGYSDMAIGLGKILGFDFAENFNYPYISRSVTEFFRRWHISLGSWFRDYVYIPLGGNRKGTVRQIINLLIVWSLTGLWHGASWNFVAWGLFYAILLIAEKCFLYEFLQRLPRAVGHIYTFLAALFGFVVFDASDMNEVFNKLGGMFGVGGIAFASEWSWYVLMNYTFVFILAAIASTPLLKMLLNKLSGYEKGKTALMIAEPIVLVLLFILSTAFLVDSSFNPFIYFRF